MDSINKQQEEDNHEDLFGKEGISKIKELVEKNQICMFCTNMKTNSAFNTRPMAVQKVDDRGNLWLLSANDSHKNEELDKNNHVQLLFQGSSYSDFLSLYGTVTITKSKERIKELWKPIMKDWFTEGVDDPRITVLKVKPLEGYYWDTKHHMVVGLVKRVAGAITGKTMDDSIEGKIKV